MEARLHHPRVGVAARELLKSGVDPGPFARGSLRVSTNPGSPALTTVS
jgi:hypothetical protein